MKYLKRAMVVIAMCLGAHVAQASGLAISNFVMANKDATDDYVLLELDISWENSWRTNSYESNWDAVWVFFKYKKQGTTEWKHCTLSYVDGTGSGDGHSYPNTAALDLYDDVSGTAKGAHGVFLYSANNKSQSTASYEDVQIQWNYGEDGLADDDAVQLNAFGIEMVYVPEGSFYIGDGSGSTESAYAFHVTDNNYVQLTSSLVQDIVVDAVIDGDDDSQLTGDTDNDGVADASSYGIGIDGDGGLDTDNDGTIDNSSYPTGYNGFYVMKYELSQGMYTEFLSYITSTQASNRFMNEYGNARNGISESSGVYSCDAPYLACNYISWQDGAAFLDWAALRPITELEFEKACRGTLSPTLREYAWGSSSIHSSADYTFSNYTSSNASITNSGTSTGNALGTVNSSNASGPARCGVFAYSATTNSREETGASYYGVMELSGNLLERCVCLGNTTGRAFEGSNGDGVLSTNGNATNSDWPGYNATYSSVTNAMGIGSRGGGWESTTSLRVADRSFASYNYNGRNDSYGIRGGRTR